MKPSSSREPVFVLGWTDHWPYPQLGDVLVGILSLIIPLAAWVRGVPCITLLRMLTNVSIGLLIGSIPILGDAFDIF